MIIFKNCYINILGFVVLFNISVGMYPLSVIWIDENLVVFCVDGVYLINFDLLEKRHY